MPNTGPGPTMWGLCGPVAPPTRLEPTHWGLSPSLEQRSSCSLITQPAHALSRAHHVTSARTLWKGDRDRSGTCDPSGPVVGQYGPYFLGAAVTFDYSNLGCRKLPADCVPNYYNNSKKNQLRIFWVKANMKNDNKSHTLEVENIDKTLSAYPELLTGANNQWMQHTRLHDLASGGVPLLTTGHGDRRPWRPLGSGRGATDLVRCCGGHDRGTCVNSFCSRSSCTIKVTVQHT